MFFFLRIKSSAGFLNITPRTICTGNFVYNCTNCSWCYIGETGRAFNTRKTQITIRALYLDNTIFFLTNIHKFSTFSSFCNVRFYLNFLIDFLSFILPIEDCSSGSRKLVVFIILARGRFLNFNYVSSWLRPFNIFTYFFLNRKSLKRKQANTQQANGKGKKPFQSRLSKASE